VPALGVGAVEIGIDADDPEPVGSDLVGQRRRAEPHRTGHGKNDVRTLVVEVLGEGAPVVEGFEIVGEEPLAGFGVPPQNDHVRPVDAVVMLNPPGEPVHEDGHRRDVDAAEDTKYPRFRHSRRKIAGKKRRLVGGIDLSQNIRDGWVVGEIDD